MFLQTPQLTGIPPTLLLTLRGRADEHQRSDALFQDDLAVKWSQSLPWDEDLQKLYSPITQATWGVRAYHFDRVAERHIASHASPLVVELGAGLCNIPVETTTKKADSPLSLEQAMQAFMAQHPKGIQSFDEVDEIDYFPGMDIYRFENTKRFFQWYLDARDGSLIKYGFNASQFLEQQGFLGWLHPWIGNPIKLSSTLLTLILVGSGFVLFLSPFLARAK